MIIIESAGSGSAGASTTLKQQTGQKSDQDHRQQDRGGEINSAPTHPTNTEENRQEQQPSPTEQPPTQDPTGERENLGDQQGDLPSGQERGSSALPQVQPTGPSPAKMRRPMGYDILKFREINRPLAIPIEAIREQTDKGITIEIVHRVEKNSSSD
eukprot:Gb_28189 [translate_table: standard]